MKKNTFLFLAAGLLLSIGMISCSSSSKNTPQPTPAALITLARNPWQIQSVTFKKKDGITDSLKYTSTDSLAGARIRFGANYVYSFQDPSNASWVGPKNDSTLFRFSNGAWNFNQNWVNSVNAGNLNAVPDSLLFQASKDGYSLSGPIYRYQLSQFDSLHLQFTYLDSTILNQTTNTKYQIIKVVTLAPVAN